jgi:hypothetical protein
MFITQEDLCRHAIPSCEMHVRLEMMGVNFRCGTTQLSNGLIESTHKRNFLDYVFGQVLLEESPYYYMTLPSLRQN